MALPSSILAGMTANDVTAEPFAHLMRPECLDPAFFRALSDTMPKPAFPPGMPQNYLVVVDAFSEKAQARLSDEWRRFAAHHVSNAFWREIVQVLGPAIRRTHPGIEARIGSALEDATTGRAAGPDAVAGDESAPVRLGLQLTYNTPVTSLSSVRDAHIDKTQRLLSALLYMPEPGDDAGGELELYRHRDARRLNGVSVAATDVAPFARVPYAPNTMIMFVNSVDSVHGVLPRRPTPHTRRYVNFFVDLAEDFIDTAPYQVARAAP